MKKLYNIVYKETILYENLTAEDCGEILQNLSESFYSGEDTDPNSIKVEEI